MVYLTLPDNRLGRAIEGHIREEFPGVVIQRWDYELDGAAAGESTKPANLAMAVVVHMENRPPGKYMVNEIAIQLDLCERQRKVLKDGLKKKRKVHGDLADIGVSYVVEGERRGARAYLVMHG